MKVLIIEDDPSMCEIIERALLEEQYVVELASTYQAALQKLNDYSYDCVLLDIMLPDGSGLDILHELKKQSKKESVIILSAKDSIEDKVAGLEYGADDYLAKPFHMAELKARIKSVIRRNQQDGDLSLDLGNVKLIPDNNQVFIDNKLVDLLRKEYDILHYFMTRPNHIVDKTVLAESVWGDHIDQVDSFDFIYAQIRNLRKKLVENNSSIEIVSVYGFGYKLEEIK